MITGLAGVILWTAADRFPAMREFYRGVLGLEPRSDREQFVSFDWGARGPHAPRLTVTVHSQVEDTSHDPLRTMVNLEVDGLDELYTRLREHGVVFVRPPEVEHFGGRIATLRDPDGNLVQLLEHPRG
ncbi:MAG: hypothetical protein EXR66_08495 [Dehalococcoidia bacterium]|nr:hypothetical protein [Dehalococcoidia bacterium]